MEKHSLQLHNKLFLSKQNKVHSYDLFNITLRYSDNTFWFVTQIPRPRRTTKLSDKLTSLSDKSMSLSDKSTSLSDKSK